MEQCIRIMQRERYIWSVVAGNPPRPSTIEDYLIVDKSAQDRCEFSKDLSNAETSAVWSSGLSSSSLGALFLLFIACLVCSVRALTWRLLGILGQG